MIKVNTSRLEELVWSSPGGTFRGMGKQISEALGRKPSASDVLERHPFDVELSRTPPGLSGCPYHSHSAQWEFYLVVSGSGSVRDENGTTAIEPGDAFLFKPGEPHQITNTGDTDLTVLVVADNPFGESTHYPDSDKWSVSSPQPRIVRSEPLDYYDGEE